MGPTIMGVPNSEKNTRIPPIHAAICVLQRVSIKFATYLAKASAPPDLSNKVTKPPINTNKTTMPAL